MRQARSKKKSPAQLERDIAEVLRRAPKTTARRHATVKQPPAKADPRQEEILSIADDAALEEKFERAEAILKQGKQRTIAIAFKTVTPESAEEGDFADQGWDNEDGDEIDVSSYDIEEQVEVGSPAPVTDAIVKQAVKWLRDEGASEASSSSYHKGAWYSTEFQVTSYRTGEQKSKDFFLQNFTEPEERAVFKEFTKARR